MVTFCIALPDSFLVNAKGIRSKTMKLGTLARSMAIFRIGECWIYRSPFLKSERRPRERRQIKMILEYMECPQYLRKYLYPKHSDLEAVGTLPPLATPHHMLTKTPKDQEVRDGVIFLKNRIPVVDVGFKFPITVLNPPKYSLHEKIIRILVKIHIKNETQAEILSPNFKSHSYRGYKIKFSNQPLGKWIPSFKEINPKTGIVFTSKTGTHLKNFNKEEIEKKKELLVVFGSTQHGISEILKSEGTKSQILADAFLNLVPKTGTRSIRLEEAILISLARLEDYMEA